MPAAGQGPFRGAVVLRLMVPDSALAAKVGTTCQLSVNGQARALCTAEVRVRLLQLALMDEVDAYTAALIATDGGLFRRPGRTRVRTTLTQQLAAEPVMRRISSHYDRPLWLNRRKPPRKDQWQIAFYDDWFADCKIGVPVLAAQDVSHYLRGLIDGDGCVVDRGQSKDVRFLWQDREAFLGEFFKGFLDSQGLEYGTSKIYGNVTHCYLLAGSADRFLDFVYSGATIALPWKREIAGR